MPRTCMRSTQRPIRWLKAAAQPLRRAGAGLWGLSSAAHIMGVVVSDTTIDTRMAEDMTMANSRKNRPTMPPMNKMGTNTAISEMLIDTTVKPISRAPSSDARSAVLPRSIWRMMFSNTTMASSTTKPVATVSAISERLSSV